MSAEAIYKLRREIENTSGNHEGFKLAAIPSHHDPRNYKYESLVMASNPVTEAPAIAIDYRPNLPPVFNQGDRGSCVACATAWTPKAFEEMTQGDFPVGGLSASFLYSMCKQIDGLPGQEGTTPKAAMQVLQKYGVCPESAMPYSTLANLKEPLVPVAPDNVKKSAEK